MIMIETVKETAMKEVEKVSPAVEERSVAMLERSAATEVVEETIAMEKSTAMKVSVGMEGSAAVEESAAMERMEKSVATEVVKGSTAVEDRFIWILWLRPYSRMRDECWTFCGNVLSWSGTWPCS
jgi:hypothetical protein